MVVDFPAPLGPIKPCTSPSWTARSRPSNARTGPKILVRARTSMAERGSEVTVMVVSLGFSSLLLCDERVIHGRVRQQAVGVDLERGQHHVVAVIAQDR